MFYFHSMKAGKSQSGILEGCSFDFVPKMIFSFSALPWELRSIGIPYRPHRFDRRVWGPGSLPWGHRLLSPGCTTFAGKVDRTRCFLGWCLVEAKALAVRTQLHCEGSERKSYPLRDISRYTPQPSPTVVWFCCAIRASNLSIPKKKFLRCWVYLFSSFLPGWLARTSFFRCRLTPLLQRTLLAVSSY